MTNCTAAEQQIDELAQFIMAEIPGEPSKSEGAVDTAIRLLRFYHSELVGLLIGYRADTLLWHCKMCHANTAVNWKHMEHGPNCVFSRDG